MTRTTADLLAVADRTFVKNYRQPPFVIERGQGAELWDVAGNRADASVDALVQNSRVGAFPAQAARNVGGDHHDRRTRRPCPSRPCA